MVMMNQNWFMGGMSSIRSRTKHWSRVRFKKAGVTHVRSRALSTGSPAYESDADFKTIAVVSAIEPFICRPVEMA